MRKRKGKDFIKGYQVVKVSNAIIYIDALLVWIGRSLFLYEMWQNNVPLKSQFDSCFPKKPFIFEPKQLKLLPFIFRLCSLHIVGGWECCGVPILTSHSLLSLLSVFYDLSHITSYCLGLHVPATTHLSLSLSQKEANTETNVNRDEDVHK